jgi:exodeoxyribonuclease V alpha subunit
VFDMIEAEPDRLREVTGIGLVRAKRITDAWAEQKVVREIMTFLHSNGVGTARAVRRRRRPGPRTRPASLGTFGASEDRRLHRERFGIEKTAMIRLPAASPSPLRRWICEFAFYHPPD